MFLSSSSSNIWTSTAEHRSSSRFFIQAYSVPLGFSCLRFLSVCCFNVLVASLYFVYQFVISIPAIFLSICHPSCRLHFIYYICHFASGIHSLHDPVDSDTALTLCDITHERTWRNHYLIALHQLNSQLFCDLRIAWW